MRVSKKIVLLYVAFSSVAASASTAPPAWQGIWRGTVGASPVQVCLQGSTFGNTGGYYYTKHLKIINLAPSNAADRHDAREWREGREGRGYRENPKNPLWTNIAVNGEKLTATWSQGGKALPISLERVAQTDSDARPCSDTAFRSLRETPIKLSTQRKVIDGQGYTSLKADVGTHFRWVAMSTFQIDGNTPAVRNINTELRREIPTEPQHSEYSSCVAENLSMNGSEGEYEAIFEPVLMTKRWMVSKHRFSYTCGGAHPNVDLFWTTWNLNTGQSEDVLTWFNREAAEVTTKDGYYYAKILPRFKKLLEQKWPRKDEDCGDTAEVTDAWSARLTRQGIAVWPILPHVALACTEDVVFTFDELESLLNTTGKAKLASFRADLVRDKRK